ncbi:OB-fold nucleic acid binding domain-containing protein [Pseudomonas benzopyrenica]|uniref:OB-fold nucleic acid binding domain-containing protein n=1 Tax=Pseudomonas benzopyrenica TaxID=2993566 RepID=A0ABZ2FLG4_9PSED
MAHRLIIARDLKERCHGQPARIGGLIVGTQRAGAVSNMTFVTLEDEFGMVNVVVWRTLAERHRRELVTLHLLRVDGTGKTRDGVPHIVAGHLEDISELMQGKIPGVEIFVD